MITFREFLSTERILNESPKLVSDTNFNLVDVDFNKDLAQELLKKKQEVFKETDEIVLFRTGSHQDGYIALLDKSRGLIDYLVKYHANREFSYLPKSMTQVLVWRSLTSNHVTDLTTNIFFGYLLEKHGMMMSDKSQTIDGRNFWIRMMAKAISRNKRVGIVFMNHQKVEWFDKSKSFSEWIENLIPVSYGYTEQFKSIRFLISNGI